MQSVPGNIFFGFDLLSVPTFEEVGIPEFFGRFGRLESSIQPGQWINRGDVLITLHYDLYRNERKIRFLPDPKWTVSESLLSQISGFVLDFRSEKVRTWLGGTHFTSANVWPIILLPKDEPPQDSHRIEFFQQIGLHLRNSWRLLHFYHEVKGEVRYGDLVLENKDDPRCKSAIRAIESFSQPKLRQFGIRQFTSDDEWLLNKVQHFRAHDLVLRDKLVHLTKL